MTRIQPCEPIPFTTRRFARTLAECHPYLRSGSVCLTTATTADEEEKRRQRRDERVVLTVLGAVLIGILAALCFNGLGA